MTRVTLPPHIVAISKGKEVAQQWMKYLGGYLSGVPTIFSDRVPTMGVDQYGRLYCNPEWCLKFSDEQNAYVLLHEMAHNMLGHADRRSQYLPNATPDQLRVWNEAADLCIQQILSQWDRYRPRPSVELAHYAHVPGMAPNLSTERYFGLLWNNGQPQQPKHPGQNGQPQPNSQGQPGDGDDSSDGQGQQSGGSGNPKSGTPSKGKQPHTESGSCADGVRREYELDADLTSAAMNLARLEEVREAMDNDGSIGRGSGLGTLRQGLNVRLRRQPDPFEQLKSIVGKETSSNVGVDEYTYRRLSRMQQHDNYPMRGVIKMAPECVIVLDTSGSMGSGARGERVSRALTAIAHGVRRLRNPRVISWDDGIRSDSKCDSIRNFQWIGGGGTGMSRAVEWADQKYRPDCIVLVTDGGTCWPDKPTRARLVVAAVAKDGVPPSWARYVDLTREPNAHVG